MLLHLTCVVSGLGVALAGAFWFSAGHAAHVVCGGILFALGAAGVGLQCWHPVKRLRGGEGPKWVNTILVTSPADRMIQNG
jgi:hypothetical protein